MSHSDPFEPRRKPVQARARATVEAILQATAQVLVREGFDRANTNRIAEVAGVSIGTLYQYFPNKESLLVSLVNDNIDQAITVTTQLLTDMEGAPAHEIVAMLIKAVIELERVSLTLRQQLVTHLPREKIFEKYRHLYERSRPFVRNFLESRRDEIVPDDLDMATMMVISTVEMSIATTLLFHPERLSDGSLHRELTRMICRYLFDTPQSTLNPGAD